MQQIPEVVIISDNTGTTIIAENISNINIKICGDKSIITYQIKKLNQ